MNHDVIVIGASAGGVEVLLKLAGALPADLPASIFLVIHTLPGHRSELPELLSRRGPLPSACRIAAARSMDWIATSSHRRVVAERRSAM